MRCVLADVPGQHVPYQLRDHQPNGSAGKLANGNGRWCATVASECAESARYLGLAALSAAEDIFGEPLYPDPAEHQDVQVLRNQLARPGDPPTKHLGEAETVAITARRRLSCFLVTDDRDAARLATQNGIADTLWGYMQTPQGEQPGNRS